MRIDTFLEGLVSHLEEQTDNKFQVAEPPSDNPKTPYGVIFVLPGRTDTGSLDAVADEVCFSIQVMAVGSTTSQSALLQSKVLAALVGPGKPDFVIDGLPIQRIHLTGNGPLLDSGQSLFNAVSTYEVVVPL